MLSTAISTTRDIDWSIFHVNSFLQTIDAIRLQLNEEVFRISNIQNALYKLNSLPKELANFKRVWSLTQEQLVLIEKLEQEIPNLVRQAKILLPSVKQSTIAITRNLSIPRLPDDVILLTFAFLSFGDLATCLRVNRFFLEVAFNSTIQDRCIFLNKEKTIYLNLQRSFKDHPLKLGDILHGRKKAFSASSFWQREKTKLDKVPGELRKLGFSLSVAE